MSKSLKSERPFEEGEVIRGKPLALSKEKIDAIAERLLYGVTLEVAAMSVGVHPRTLQKYMVDAAKLAAGSPDSERFTHRYKRALRYFFMRIAKAEAEYEVVMAKAIADAAKTDWRAAAESLARRRPRRWSSISRRYAKHQVEVLRNNPAITDLRELSTRELEQLLASTTSAGGLPLPSGFGDIVEGQVRDIIEEVDQT